MTPPPLDLAGQLTVAKFLAETIAGRRTGDLVPEAQGTWPATTRIPVAFGGKHTAWVAMPKGSKSAAVSDPAKYLAWAREKHPHQVADEVTVRVTPQVIAVLEEHLPGALIRTPVVDQHWTDDITKALKEKGFYVTRDGEKLTEVPGITVSEKPGVPTVTLEKDAGETITAAWRAGLIPLDGLLALTAAAPEPGPAPAPEPDPAAGPATDGTGWLPPGVYAEYFGEDGRFLSPEAAARHAIEVQGGFSTPELEARRMMADGLKRGDVEWAAMAREWLVSRGLPVADPGPVSEPAS